MDPNDILGNLLPPGIKQLGGADLVRWLASQAGQVWLQQTAAQQQPAAEQPPTTTPARPPGPYGQAGEPTQNPGEGAPAQVSGGQTTTPAGGFQIKPIGPPQGPGGTYTVDQLMAGSDDAVTQANQDVARLWDAINAQQKVVDTLQGSTNPADAQKLNSAVSQLNTLYTTLATAQSRLESANVARQATLKNAIDAGQVAPAQVNLANSQAQQARDNATLAHTQADILTLGAEGNRSLVSAQAGLAANQALAAKATADRDTALIDPMKAQYQAQADLYSKQAAQIQSQIDSGIYQAQAGLYDAQAGLTRTQARTQAATAAITEAQVPTAERAAEASTGTLEANQQIADANARTQQALAALAPGFAQTQLGQVQANLAQTQATTGLTGAQTQLTGTQGVNTLTSALQNLANIQKGVQGPLYGMQNQLDLLNQIAAQVWSPGATPGWSEQERQQHANDLLQQYVNSAIGGTTPYQGATTAGLYGQQAYQTASTMANELAANAAARSTGFMNYGANILGTLAAMNANAPAGSTALVGAVQDVLNNMQSRLAGPQFQPPPMPQAPALPPFLQQYAAPSAQAPSAAAAPAAAPGSTSAPVTINIGGGGAPSGPAAPTPAQVAPTSATGPGDWFSAWQQRQAQDVQQQNAQAQVPAVLRGYQGATPDSLHALWGNELASGAVQSPYGQAA